MISDQVFEILKVVFITFTTLFPIINPIGTSVIFLNLTEEADHALRKNIAKKIALNSILLMTFVLIFGTFIISFFGISIPVIQFCGGAVILSMGWKMLNNPDEDQMDRNKESSVKPEIELGKMYKNKAFYPLTFPLTVGPGTFAVTLTLSAQYAKGNILTDFFSYLAAFIGMIALAFSVYFFYANSDRLVAKFSRNLRRIFLRIISFILLCIGTEIVIMGLTSIVKRIIENLA